jgi:hypothetical protein
MAATVGEVAVTVTVALVETTVAEAVEGASVHPAETTTR